MRRNSRPSLLHKTDSLQTKKKTCEKSEDFRGWSLIFFMSYEQQAILLTSKEISKVPN